MASEALGINAPLDCMEDGDTPDIYYEDMIKTGGGLSDPSLCRILADESADRINELIDLGVCFAKKNGRLEQQKLSGCTKARSFTCGGSTGRQIVNALKKAAVNAGVRILENTRLTGLCKNGGAEVCGAYGMCGEEKVRISAKAVVLATGGAGSLFATNVNPSTQQGDGWAMAYEAGCRFVNMEFFQVGPAIAQKGLKFIIHSHMWRFIPRLTNCHGEEFLAGYCKNGVSPREALDLKAMSYPFSVRTDAKYVDISIFKEVTAGRGGENGGIYFDVTHVPREELLRKAPVTYNTLLAAGLDCAEDALEITLAAQNFNGGVLIDRNGFTGVKGLYAAGEVTGGVHGSDRPGGNNLTDAQVFGYRAGRAAAAYAQGVASPQPAEASAPLRMEVTPEEQSVIQESKKLFYDHLTIVRTAAGLKKVLGFADHYLQGNPCDQLRNRLTVGKLIAMAGLFREESRGTHYREDYPDTDPAWLKRIVLYKGEHGAPVVEFED